MAYCKNFGQREAAQTLNVIDLIWHDNSEIKNRWADLHNSLDDNAGFTPAQIDDKFKDLLTAIAKDLGIGDRIGSADFARIYYPRGIANREKFETLQVNEAIAELERRVNVAPAPNPPTTAPAQPE